MRIQKIADDLPGQCRFFPEFFGDFSGKSTAGRSQVSYAYIATRIFDYPGGVQDLPDAVVSQPPIGVMSAFRAWRPKLAQQFSQARVYLGIRNQPVFVPQQPSDRIQNEQRLVTRPSPFLVAPNVQSSELVNNRLPIHRPARKGKRTDTRAFAASPASLALYRSLAASALVGSSAKRFRCAGEPEKRNINPISPSCGAPAPQLESAPTPKANRSILIREPPFPDSSD